MKTNVLPCYEVVEITDAYLEQNPCAQLKPLNGHSLAFIIPGFVAVFSNRKHSNGPLRQHNISYFEGRIEH